MFVDVSSVTYCKFIAPTSLFLKPGPTLQQATVRSEVRATNSRTGTPIIHCTGAWPSGRFVDHVYTAPPGERSVRQHLFALNGVLPKIKNA